MSMSRHDVDPASIRVFLHYPPQFWKLHEHFCLVSNSTADAGCEHAHLLDDVVQLLELKSDFNIDATLKVVVKS
jgi:hypothetical protein